MFRHLVAAALTLALSIPAPGPATAAGLDLSGARPGFATGLLEGLGEDGAFATELGEWYGASGFAPLWTGPDAAPRRAALLAALDGAEDHGLPAARYGAGRLRALLASAESEADLGRIEAAWSRAYLLWARDISSGMLEPSAILPSIVREIARPAPADLMRALSEGDPGEVLRGLLPRSEEYVTLMRTRFELEEMILSGGWGRTVPGGTLRPGDSGPAVIALRDRMVRMGFLARSASPDYDAALAAAVRGFQKAHGLEPDGVAGPETLAEINRPAEERLRSVLVAMERLRWMNGIERSGRMIWVNIPDFTARIMEEGATVFATRAVVGSREPDRQTPEFSDEMEHMVVNPSWHVPRSIVVKEYLPQLKRNRNAASGLELVNSRGRVVSRGEVDFAAYNERNFPFAMRQPPGRSNALGQVKFMFPNRWNIYLHDTPSKSLFSRDLRAYSHGCIRLADPMGFAHVLLAWQEDDGAGPAFRKALASGKETTVPLLRHLPVHLVYFTAWPEEDGTMGYRRDVYGRDAWLWSALEAAGVVLPTVSQ